MSEAATPAPAAPASNNKMMFIMMGVMFVVLLVGMAGMFFMLKGGKSESASAEHADAKDQGDKDQDKEKDKNKEKSGPRAAAIYIGFEPPFVVNFPADSPVKFLQLSVQIMTREATVEHEIKGNDPAIRDALLHVFGQQTADKLATSEGKDALRAQALEAVRNVIRAEGGEADKVEAVYFTTFVMQ